MDMEKDSFSSSACCVPEFDSNMSKINLMQHQKSRVSPNFYLNPGCIGVPEAGTEILGRIFVKMHERAHILLRARSIQSGKSQVLALKCTFSKCDVSIE